MPFDIAPDAPPFWGMRTRHLTALGLAILFGGCAPTTLPTAEPGQAYFRIGTPPGMAVGALLRVEPVTATVRAAGGTTGNPPFSVDRLPSGEIRVLAGGSGLPARYDVLVQWSPSSAPVLLHPVALITLDGEILPPVGVTVVPIDPALAAQGSGTP